MTDQKMRLQKYLAHQGLGSRRTVEKMIGDRRIAVNGEIVTQQGTKVDPDIDVVTVDGDIIENLGELEYYWFNKPAGVVSSSVSQDGEPTVIEYINTPTRIYPVGRLDKDSRGLMLLTNDGLLTHRLTHPKFHISKTYEVTVVGKVTDRKLNKLRSGIRLEEGMTAPAEVEVIQNQVLRFILHEGKNRQIRRMCEVVNLEVVDLIRTGFGPVTLTNLSEGSWREATTQEVYTLYGLVKLPTTSR